MGVNFIPQICHLCTDEMVLPESKEAQEVISLQCMQELWPCDSADGHCSVAGRHGRSQLLMLGHYMAVHHVLFDKCKCEVYHFP